MSKLPLEIGVAARPMAGRPESGDRFVLCPFEGGVLVGVLDGLGTGPGACDAARIASSTLMEHTGDSLASLFVRCHERLRSARGVVMSLACFRSADNNMTWAGVGDVDGILIRGRANGGSPREYLLLKPGVVGAHFPALEAAVLPVGPGDTLLFLTDGIRKDVLDAVRPGLSSQGIANRILRNHGKGTDDALVMVARYRGLT